MTNEQKAAAPAATAGEPAHGAAPEHGEAAGHVHGPNCSHGHGHHHHDAGPQTPFVRAQPKVGRNDPCVCGSGQKFKKCCGKEP